MCKKENGNSRPTIQSLWPTAHGPRPPAYSLRPTAYGPRPTTAHSAILAILLVLSICSHAHAIEIMTVDEIQPGMKGYGKTVFEGTEVETFDVKVIDVVENWYPKRHLILIKLSGHPMIEKAGVIGGMSGSPIFINDKLIGALSYGWIFVKEPIAGVMPIEYMLEEVKRPLEKTSFLPSDERRFSMRPLVTPLMVTGLTPRTLALLEEELKAYNLVPVQGGGAGKKGARPVRLEPGSAIGIQLMRGDYDFTAVGTLTYIDKDVVLAFGHPFLGVGEISAPLTSGYVHTVLPSLAVSMKFSSSVEEVGSMIQDRFSCVYGRLGKKADMIPVSVSLKNLKTDIVEKMNVEVFRHDYFTSILVMISCINFLELCEPATPEQTIYATTELDVEGGRKVIVKSAGDASGLVRRIRNAVQQVITNPFKKTTVDGVRIHLDVVNERKDAALKAAWVNRSTVSPGESVVVTVLLEVPNSEKDDRLEFSVKVPDDARPGTMFDINVHGAFGLSPDLPPPGNLDDYLSSLERFYDPHLLVVRSGLSSLNLKYKGEVLPNVPQSALSKLIPGITEDAVLGQDIQETVVETKWLVSGHITVRVKVE